MPQRHAIRYPRRASLALLRARPFPLRPPPSPIRPERSDLTSRRVGARRSKRSSTSSGDDASAEEDLVPSLPRLAPPARRRRLSLLTSYRFIRPEADGRVVVDIPVVSGEEVATVANAVEARGGVVLHASERYGTIRARVHLENLEDLAAIPQVRGIFGAPGRSRTRSTIPKATGRTGPTKRERFFETTSAGMKVGVLCDGVDSLAALQASGDLPAVTVLPGQAGSGHEGSAMLEIVHDLAPAAPALLRDGDHLSRSVRSKHSGPCGLGLPRHR